MNGEKLSIGKVAHNTHLHEEKRRRNQCLQKNPYEKAFRLFPRGNGDCQGYHYKLNSSARRIQSRFKNGRKC